MPSPAPPSSSVLAESRLVSAIANASCEVVEHRDLAPAALIPEALELVGASVIRVVS